ncbi:MAG: Ku protein [Polyangiaceae bacterium]
MMATKRTSKAHPRRSPAANEDGHTARALWSGTIGFGLVQIPVSLVPAEKSHELSFHQLDERDMSPIGYDRINKTTGKKVEWEHIVKGYEITKGKFVIVTDDDFKKANVESTQSIDIEDFVDRAEIHPTYYERPYYLLPGKKGQKAYAVLRDALAAKDLVAIALVVIRTRQHLCAVMAEGNRLLLELLRFDHELRSAAETSSGKSEKASPKEIKLAEQLIDGMVTTWDPKKYKDTYTSDLLAAIREKAKTGTIAPRHAAKHDDADQHEATDLISLLQRSVSAKKGGASGKKAKTAKSTKSHNSKRKAA